jgi:hypothetical protein
VGAVGGALVYFVLLRILYVCLDRATHIPLATGVPAEFGWFTLLGQMFTDVLLAPIIKSTPNSDTAEALRYGLIYGISCAPFAILGAILVSRPHISKRTAWLILSISTLLSCPGFCAFTQGVMFATLPYGIEGSFYSSDQAQIMAPYFFCGGGVVLLVPAAVGYLVFLHRPGTGQSGLDSKAGSVSNG